MGKNNKIESQNKHIDINYLVSREHAKDQTTVIEHTSIELMIVVLKQNPKLMF